jgi:hypothetical protein
MITCRTLASGLLSLQINSLGRRTCTIAIMYISINTVRSHIQAIYRKLGVATRAEAVTHAHRLGLLPGDVHRSVAIASD